MCTASDSWDPVRDTPIGEIVVRWVNRCERRNFVFDFIAAPFPSPVCGVHITKLLEWLTVHSAVLPPIIIKLI